MGDVSPRVAFVIARGATSRCGFVTLTAPPCSNTCIPQIYMLSFRRVHTYWYLNSLALRPNGRHLLINFSILQAVPWNPNWKCQWGLEVDLALFRRQATARTSDDIDHRRIHASTEQNLTLPHSMTVERYFYVVVIILYSVLLTLFLLMILYVYLLYHCPQNHLFVLIIPLINPIFIGVFYVLYIAILPLFMLRIYSCMYCKSGTSDLLVLMLFVLQCTEY